MRAPSAIKKAVVRLAVGAVVLTGAGAGAVIAGDGSRTQAATAAGESPFARPGTPPSSANAAGKRTDAPIVRTVPGFSTVPLRELAPRFLPSRPRAENDEREPRLLPYQSPTGWLDPALQTAPARGEMPAPSQTFDGLSSADNVSELGFAVRPPDTEGDVGPNHYVEYINLVMQVYNKSGVAQLASPLRAGDIFGALNGPAPHHCESDAGDPLVHYDQLADRWVLSQFAYDPNTGFGPYYECVAVSQTPDPAGAYCVYAFLTSPTVFPDYPKMGVWPDAYYFSFIGFPDSGTPPMYPAAMAVERAQMLLPGCQPADMVYFDNTNSGLNQNLNRMLPTDLDGPTPPPAGEPNYYYMHFDDSANVNDHLEQWEFKVDWAIPANSTFTKAHDIAVPAFDMSYSCTNTRECIPQSGTTNRLDLFINPGRGRLMYEANYRNYGTHRSVVLTHSVDAATNLAAVRWYELRNPEGTPAAFQASTYNPGDGHHRWMQSAAMDKRGNLAVGYSISSSSVFPSLRYAGRLVSDPPNTLSQGEATLYAGTGSQLAASPTDLGRSRWGDYTRLTVDPVDDCTFWYIGQYYAQSSVSAWRTRIGSFIFPECLVPTAVAVRAFSARWRGKGVEVLWRTASETTVAGFNVYRSVGPGPFKRVNPALIRAKQKAPARGASYRYVDRTVRRGAAYSYRLQVVSTAGKRTWHSIGAAASG